MTTRALALHVEILRARLFEASLVPRSTQWDDARAVLRWQLDAALARLMAALGLGPHTPLDESEG